jgi:hypothetical protein
MRKYLLAAAALALGGVARAEGPIMRGGSDMDKEPISLMMMDCQKVVQEVPNTAFCARLTQRLMDYRGRIQNLEIYLADVRRRLNALEAKK